MSRLAAFALALALASPAFAETRPLPSAERLEIRDERTGARMGVVRDAERDGQGRIVSISAEGLEAPADAPPYLMAPRRPAPPVYVAEGQDSASTLARTRAR
jgi:hypothetical protein